MVLVLTSSAVSVERNTILHGSFSKRVPLTIFQASRLSPAPMISDRLPLFIKVESYFALLRGKL